MVSLTRGFEPRLRKEFTTFYTVLLKLEANIKKPDVGPFVANGALYSPACLNLKEFPRDPARDWTISRTAIRRERTIRRPGRNARYERAFTPKPSSRDAPYIHGLFIYPTSVSNAFEIIRWSGRRTWHCRVMRVH